MEYIKIFYNYLVYSLSGNRSGLCLMVLKLANFTALKRYDPSIQF